MNEWMNRWQGLTLFLLCKCLCMFVSCILSDCPFYVISVLLWMILWSDGPSSSVPCGHWAAHIRFAWHGHWLTLVNEAHPHWYDFPLETSSHQSMSSFVLFDWGSHRFNLPSSNLAATQPLTSSYLWPFIVIETWYSFTTHSCPHSLQTKACCL